MRTIDRTLRRRLLANAGLVGAAVAAVGVAYGAMAVNAGLPVWFAPLVGTLVLAASSEMLFVGILAAGGSPWMAAAAALTVNARHLPYGLAVSPLLGRGWARALRIHLVSDETVVFALDQDSPDAGRAAFTWCGLGILLTWPLGAVLGSILGQSFDVATLGLDAMFPAVILALILSAFLQARTRAAALLAAAVAICATPLVPAGLAPLLALLALPFIRRAKGRHRA